MKITIRLCKREPKARARQWIAAGLVAGFAGLVAVVGLSGALAPSAHAQADAGPAIRTEHLDIGLTETKTLTFDHAVEDFTVSAPAFVNVDRAEGSQSQLTVSGLVLGSANVRVRVGGQTIDYLVTVTPQPERIYINIPESKRLTFAKPVDDVAASKAGVVRIVQPNDNVVLLEALDGGQGNAKTTVTVQSGGQLYRYFVSTLENRGADMLEIQNAFAAKGYKNLVVAFDRDQVTITGSVPTQEELDDAVRIVKQYTPYVIVRAALGTPTVSGQFEQEEAFIVNSIKRISGVPKLTVVVQFPPPQVVESFEERFQGGDTFNAGDTVIGQSGVTTTSSGRFDSPRDDEGNNRPPPRPRAGTERRRATTINRTVPQKIFLYGELEDDLQEARVLRVARTFCPYVVSFLQVKDPIQLRVRLSFIEVDLTRGREMGVLWFNSNSGTDPVTGLPVFSGPNVSLDNLSTSYSNLASGSFGSQLLSNLTYGLTMDWSATLRFTESRGITKTVQSATLFLLNGQPGTYQDGGNVPVVIGFTSGGPGSPPVPVVGQQEVGITVLIQPLTAERGQQAAVTGGARSDLVVNFPNSLSNTNLGEVASLGKYMNLLTAPYNGQIDESVKYVGENGLIGMNVRTQIAAPAGNVLVAGQETSSFSVRNVNTRAFVNNGQSVVVSGLNDKSRRISSNEIPWVSRIPILGYLFKNPSRSERDREILLVVSPEIVRMKGPQSGFTPKPTLPETQEQMTEQGPDGVVPVASGVERYEPPRPKARPSKRTKTVASASTRRKSTTAAPALRSGVEPTATITLPAPEGSTEPAPTIAPIAIDRAPVRPRPPEPEPEPEPAAAPPEPQAPPSGTVIDAAAAAPPSSPASSAPAADANQNGAAADAPDPAGTLP